MDVGTTGPASPAAPSPSGGSGPAPGGGDDTRSAVAATYGELVDRGSFEPDEGGGDDVPSGGDGLPGLFDHEATPAATTGDRPRDERGRFTEGKPPVVDPAAPLKPPADWRGDAKAYWDKLPRPVQQEALRLHVETKKGLQELAASRKAAQEWQTALEPHKAFFDGVGLPPPAAVDAAIRFFVDLEAATPQQRAATVADVVRATLGTDDAGLQLLARALDGSEPPPPSPQQIQQAIETQAQQRARALVDQAEWRRALTDWETFAKSAPEFLNEPGFRHRLAVELQIATQGRQPTTEDLRQAFEAAKQSHPAVRKVVQQREEAKAARERARLKTAGAAAAASIRNEPTSTYAADSGPAGSTREEVAREWKRLGRGRHV